jgi:hypothetical protein
MKKGERKGNYTTRKYEVKTWETDKNFPALKIPRQCSSFLLVKVVLREGKALGNGKLCGTQ